MSRALEIIGGVDNDEDEDNGVGTVTFANADSNDDDNEDEDENDVLSFGRRFIWHWDKRKNKIEHDERLGIVRYARSQERCCRAVDRDPS